MRAFRRYSGELLAFFRKETSSSIDAEDLLQDIFYRSLVSEAEGESIEHLRAWLYRVARNLLIDRGRKRREEAMPQRIKDDGVNQRSVALSDLLPSEGRVPDEELLDQLIGEQIEAALAELPEEQRRVFELHELQGVPFKEIEAATGIPLNTLLARKRYATQALRRKLGELYEEL